MSDHFDFRKDRQRHFGGCRSTQIQANRGMHSGEQFLGDAIRTQVFQHRPALASAADHPDVRRRRFNHRAQRRFVGRVVFRDENNICVHRPLPRATYSA